jgi:hypothetical protein
MVAEVPWTLHAIQRRFLTEDLVRVRSADEHALDSVAARRRINPNPHQIDVVVCCARSFDAITCEATSSSSPTRSTRLQPEEDRFRSSIGRGRGLSANHLGQLPE